MSWPETDLDAPVGVEDERSSPSSAFMVAGLGKKGAGQEAQDVDAQLDGANTGEVVVDAGGLDRGDRGRTPIGPIRIDAEKLSRRVLALSTS